MKILVMYYSRTGRTKALAEAVASGVEDVEGMSSILREAEAVTENDFRESDGVIAGSPVYFGTMAAEVKSVFDRLIGTRKEMAGKVGAAFVSGNHHTGGKETTLLSILQVMVIYGMLTVGDPLESGGHYGIATAGDPSDDALREARLHGRRVAEIARTFRRGRDSVNREAKEVRE